MSLKRLSRAFGSIQDVAHLQSIDEDDCHILFVSGRTLYLMQNYASEEVNFLARYADSFTSDGLFYEPVELDSANLDFVQRVAQNYRLEVNDLNCVEVIASIDNLAAQVGLINVNLQGAVGCGCDGDQFDPAPLTDEDVENPGEGYLDDKCRVANVLHDRVLNMANTLDSVGVVNLLNLGVGTATAIIGGLVAAGPAGWGALLVVGVVSGILLLIVQLSAGEFGTLATELDENQDDLICALFSATDAPGAREAYIDILDAQSVNVIVQQIVAFMLTNSVCNQLFQPTGSYVDGTDWISGGYTPTDCDGCGTDTLVFYEFGGVAAGSGDLSLDGEYRVLSSVEFASEGVHRLQFRVNDATKNMTIRFIDLDETGVTGWPTCRAVCHPGGEVQWIHDDAGDGLGPDEEVGTGYFDAGNIKINSTGSGFELGVIIQNSLTEICP